jgi:hypothetical protein
VWSIVRRIEDTRKLWRSCWRSTRCHWLVGARGYTALEKGMNFVATSYYLFHTSHSFYVSLKMEAHVAVSNLTRVRRKFDAWLS